MADLLEKEEVCPSSPKKERSVTMVIFFHASVESCGGDPGISSREERSGLLVLKGKEYDNGQLSPFFRRELRRWPKPSSSREEEDCPSSPKKQRAMTMVIFFQI